MILNHDWLKDGTHIIEMEACSDERTEVEKALKKAFNDTSLIRAGLIAAGVAEANPGHAHSTTYEDMSENIKVERIETGREEMGLPVIEIRIKDNT